MSKLKPAPLPVDAPIGDLRVCSLLASGGFGLVYVAVDAQGRRVAVKEYMPSALATRSVGTVLPIVHPGKEALFAEGLQSFVEEARTLAQIRHPAVVDVHRLLRDHGTVYLVMDYLRGAPLQSYVLAARRPGQGLHEATIRCLFDEIVQGLRQVHLRKMLHLDIKPANILLTDDDRAVLIDFGASRQVLSNRTPLAKAVYTPGFAAPEMHRHDPTLGPWTDIYAVGACIYACMTGRPPPSAQSRMQNDRLPELLARCLPFYSQHLVELVAWCMSLNPLARPQSAFVVQKAINHAGLAELTYPSRRQMWRWRLAVWQQILRSAWRPRLR